MCALVHRPSQVYGELRKGLDELAAGTFSKKVPFDRLPSMRFNKGHIEPVPTEFLRLLPQGHVFNGPDYTKCPPVPDPARGLAFDTIHVADAGGSTGWALDDFRTWLAALSDMDNKGDYRNVLTNEAWLHFYQVKRMKSIAFTKGVEDKTYARDVLPCHECGVWVDKNAVTIDHHEAQEGGGPFAVVKVLRALGLTEGAAVGTRSQRSVGGVLGFFSTSETVVPTRLEEATPDLHSANKRHLARERKYGGAATRNALHQRYVLKEEGRALLAVLVHAMSAPVVEDFAMNSTVNLAPLCGRCNMSRGNRYTRATQRKGSPSSKWQHLV